MGTLLARLRALPPARFDALLGVAVYLGLCAEIVLVADVEGRHAGALPRAGKHVRHRRRAARRALLAVPLAAAGIAAGGLIDPGSPTTSCWRSSSRSSSATRPGATLDGWRLLVAFALGAAVFEAFTLARVPEDDLASFVFSTAFMIGTPMLFGHLLRNRARLNEALREKAGRAGAPAGGAGGRGGRRGADPDRRRAARRRRPRALGDDRAGVRGAPLDRPRSRARRTRSRRSGTGREALTELRRLLGVLRKDEELARAAA